MHACTQGAHEDDLYGDINTVSGIPWPVATADPKWVRMRLLNAASARPYLLKLMDGGKDVGQGACWVSAVVCAWACGMCTYAVRGQSSRTLEHTTNMAVSNDQ